MPQAKMKVKARLPPKTKVKVKNVMSATRKGAPMKAKVISGTQKLNQVLEKAIRANIEAQVRSEAGSSNDPSTSSKRSSISRKQTTKTAMKNMIRKLK